MKPESLLGHCLTLLEQIERNRSTPADELTSAYTRARKYLGSSERRALSEIVFATLRTRNASEYVATRIVGLTCSSMMRALLGAVAAVAPRWASLQVAELLEDAAGYSLELAPSIAQFYAEYAGKALPASWYDDITTALDELEQMQRDDDATLALQSCLPEWMVASFRRHGMGSAQIRALGASLMLPAPVVLRCTDRALPRENIIATLSASGIAAKPTVLSPDGIVLERRAQLLTHPLYRNGILELQDEGSQLVSFALAPEPHWRILDACAGAGGKTLHLASLQSDHGHLVASDSDASRLRFLRQRLRRHHFRSIEILPLPSAPAKQQRALHGSFDAVVLDVPCSGTGTVRRSPEIKWRLQPSNIQRFVARQRSILESYAPYVRPGGILLYATCSLLFEENEEVAEWFLSERSDFAPDSIAPAFERYGIPVELTPEQWHLRLTPDRHGTDGFFIARMRRL